MFITTTAQQFDTKIYNHIESLLHISAIYRKVFEKTTLADCDMDVQLSAPTIKPDTKPILTVTFSGKSK